jgi:hypothetical protein
MHCVLLYHIGNVLFLVLHTGMATGIRIVSFLTPRSRYTRIEIIPFEPDQRSYLRREASSVLHYLLPPSLPREGGQCGITDSLPFRAAFRKIWVTNKCVSQRGRVHTHRANFLQQLHRSWNLIESFAVSFVAMNFIGGVRYANPNQYQVAIGVGK